MMERRPETTIRTMTDEDLMIARRVADYYIELKSRFVHEPALSTCTLAFQQAITRTPAEAVTLAIGEKETSA